MLRGGPRRQHAPPLGALGFVLVPPCRQVSLTCLHGGKCPQVGPKDLPKLITWTRASTPGPQCGILGGVPAGRGLSGPGLKFLQSNGAGAVPCLCSDVDSEAGQASRADTPERPHSAIPAHERTGLPSAGLPASVSDGGFDLAEIVTP